VDASTSKRQFPWVFSFSLISLALSFFGATLSGGSAAKRQPGNLGGHDIDVPRRRAGAVENLGVRTIGVLRTGGSLGAARRALQHG